MTVTSLHTFAERVREARRIRFGDLRRLQRDVLPDGITSREEAEILLEMDRAADRTDPDWPGFLAGALKGYVASAATGPGGPPPDLAVWLSSRIPAPRTRAARAVVDSLRAEMEAVAADPGEEAAISVEPDAHEACGRAPSADLRAIA